MAHLVLIKNPLAPHERQRFALAEGERPIDWLQRHYPLGCGGAVRFFVNGEEKPLDDLDYRPARNDAIVLTVSPAFEEITLGAILTQLAIAAVLTAASIALTYLLAKPTPPPFAQPDASEPSPVYSVRSNQNVARLAEPVPVPYGNVLHTPDLCSQPYNFYLNGNEQYLDMLLCLGAGDFTVQQILVGDSDVASIADNAVQVHVAPPSEHLQAMGNLHDVFDPPFYENVVTSAEVGQQLFFTTGDNFGWFRLGKAGQTGRYIECDLFWRDGLYRLTTAGDTLDIDVGFTISIIEADVDGNPVAGTQQDFALSQSTILGRNPTAATFTVDAGYSAMWLVKLARDTDQYPLGGEVNVFTWTAAKLRVDNAAGAVYGNTTLLCVRFRATAVSSQANNQIKVRLQRNLPPLGSGAAVATTSPADAFCDILTNTDYGARRPLSEVDTARFAALKDFWALGGHSYGFNAVYTGRTTVWQALTDSLAVVAATPLPLGALMSATQDGIKETRTILFSDQNMAHDSFAITYSFDRDGDHDGIEVEYRNPDTWKPAFVRWPEDSVDPDKQQLFGCSDSRQAGEFARLQWQRKGGNRRAVQFDTELEGLIPILGERAAISHTLPRWGQSGFVVAVSGLVVTLDRKLLWDDPTLTPPYVITFRDETGGISNVVECTRGATDNVAMLAGDPWAGTDGDWSLSMQQELTHFVFGDATHAVKDFILAHLAPKDHRQVSVQGFYYDPTVYPGTFAFLAYPVP